MQIHHAAILLHHHHFLRLSLLLLLPVAIICVVLHGLHHRTTSGDKNIWILTTFLMALALLHIQRASCAFLLIIVDAG